MFQLARTRRLGVMLRSRTVILRSQKKTAKSFVVYARKILGTLFVYDLCHLDRKNKA